MTTSVNVDLFREKFEDHNGLSHRVAELRTTTVEEVGNGFNGRVPPIMRPVPLYSDQSRCYPAPEIEKKLWEIRQPHRTRYVTMGSNGELRVVEGIPNPDYGPSK